MSEIRLTGGCQCGAVRYALLKQPERPAICHCRMCQKAGGNLFGVFSGVEREFFELTRGSFSVFVTSDEGERCFCNQCGTPLAWRKPDQSWVSVTIGSLDDPEAVKPVRFYGEEGRISWAAEIVAHEATITGVGAKPTYAEDIRQSNHQHPDHDTAIWPPH